MESNGSRTAYDEAVNAALTQDEKERLLDLRVRFNVPPDSPEWVFYALLAPLFALPADREGLIENIKSSLASSASGLPNAPPSGSGRTLFEQCLDLCSSIEEKERLQRLAIRLGLSENAPAWVIIIMHGEARAALGMRSLAGTSRPVPASKENVSRDIVIAALSGMALALTLVIIGATFPVHPPVWVFAGACILCAGATSTYMWWAGKRN